MSGQSTNGGCVERDLGLSQVCLDIGLKRNFLEKKVSFKIFLTDATVRTLTPLISL